MGLPPLLIQSAVSLAAILALAGLAWWLKLGGAPALDCAEAVRRAAADTQDGFNPVAIACDSQGKSALARDAKGQIMVIKRHGNRFAGRILGPEAQAHIWRDCGITGVQVDCGEARFGTVFIGTPDANTWADAINRVSVRTDA